MTVTILLAFITLLLLVTVALPLVRSTYWIFRILEYPRFQKFLLCLIMLVLWIAHAQWQSVIQISAVILLTLASVYLFIKILPYTVFSRKEMKQVKPGQTNYVRLFTANVYEENTNYNLLLDQIKITDPDIIFLVETDEAWLKAVDGLSNHYPFTLKLPKSDTYGLLLYSRYQIISGEIKHLVEPDIPSVELDLRLPSGKLIKIFGLHPKPPVPGEDLRSTAKDKELMKVAFRVSECNMPVIVMGDLNDVAWSHTTELFRKTSRLLDPRRGRGFYSTFNAKNRFMRFPLDYIFCSSEFGLVEMKRMPENGSDHFAMFIHLSLHPALSSVQESSRADAGELKSAAEKARA